MERHIGKYNNHFGRRKKYFLRLFGWLTLRWRPAGERRSGPGVGHFHISRKEHSVHRLPRIILLVETSHEYGRGLLRGIAKYSRIHGPWSFITGAPHYCRADILRHSKAIRHYKPDGLIVREPRNLQVFFDLKIPFIVSPIQPSAKIPAIVSNAELIAQMAATHLIERGFRRFAFCGFSDMIWSRDRRNAFRRIIESRGDEFRCFERTVSGLVNPLSKEYGLLLAWLRSLPKSLGVMSCNDDMGRIVLQGCKTMSIPVPEQMAVIGVDNDHTICELTDPPLSSVALDAEMAGFQAAELLDRLIHGEKMNGQIIDHHPSMVVSRQSTDILSIEDTTVREALQYIRMNSKDPIQVADVAQAVGISRRFLHEKFRQSLGYSVSHQIKRIRVDHIIHMLLETRLPIAQIAATLNFTSTEHISRYFRDAMGTSPNEYRKQNSSISKPTAAATL
jgi:LacI family transcriptional regulator